MRQKLNYYVVYGSHLTPHHHHFVIENWNISFSNYKFQHQIIATITLMQI